MLNIFNTLRGGLSGANNSSVSPITLPLNIFANALGSLFNNPLTQNLVFGSISNITSGLIGSIVGAINPAPTQRP